MDLYPPCQECGSDGYPADIYHLGMELRRLVREDPEVDIKWVEPVDGFYCLECALEKVPMDDRSEEDMQKFIDFVLCCRLDAESSSYRGSVTPD